MTCSASLPRWRCSKRKLRGKDGEFCKCVSLLVQPSSHRSAKHILKHFLLLTLMNGISSTVRISNTGFSSVTSFLQWEKSVHLRTLTSVKSSPVQLITSGIKMNIDTSTDAQTHIQKQGNTLLLNLVIHII